MNKREYLQKQYDLLSAESEYLTKLSDSLLERRKEVSEKQNLLSTEIEKTFKKNKLSYSY